MLIDAGPKVVSAPNLTEEDQSDMQFFLGDNHAETTDEMRISDSGAEITEQADDITMLSLFYKCKS